MSDKLHWKGELLTLESVTSFARDVAAQAPYGSARFMNAVQVFIIVHFLGEPWYRRYAYLTAEKGSFLAPRLADDNDRDPTYSMRILNLAEMLFNLQGIEGFCVCLEQLAVGQLESGLAELQLGMMLYQAHQEFRYVDPAAATGRTFDLEIDFGCGMSSAAEIKCKEEATDLSVATVRNSLREARSQLPATGNGIVFVKVPQSWARANGQEIFLRLEIAEATAAFLRNTTRVALVVFYVFHLSEVSGGIRNRHAVREFPSVRNPIGPWGPTLFPLDASIKWTSMADLVVSRTATA